MTSQKGPSEAEVDSFVEKLHQFRGTLSEGDQRLLDAMYHAAMGTHETKNDEVQAYWVAAGPRGVAVGRPGVGFVASPWGAAYNTYYPYYG